MILIMKIKLYFILMVAVCLTSCNRLSYLDEPSNERQILWVSADGQIGITEMPDRNGLDLANTIKLQVLPDVDVSSLKVEIALSPGATVSPSPDVPQDFSAGPVEYIVTSETGLTRTFMIEVTVFEDFLLGEWAVSSVDVISDMDINYGNPRWPAPGLGQKSGVPINHDAATVVYVPETDGVELDNTIVFELLSVGSDGNAQGTMTVDVGPDGQSASLEVVESFLKEMNVTYKTGVAYIYPEDFNWLPSDDGTIWIHNVSGNTVSFVSGNEEMKCDITVIDDKTITLTLPANPCSGDFYTRENNDWYDRYDFTHNVIYTLVKTARQ